MDIHFYQKSAARYRGARFDWEVKKWYTTKENLHIFADLCDVKPKKVYLEIPYKMKDVAKKKGAKFDYKVKKWYIDHFNKQRYFRRFDVFSTDSEQVCWFDGICIYAKETLLLGVYNLKNENVVFDTLICADSCRTYLIIRILIYF